VVIDHQISDKWGWSGGLYKAAQFPPCNHRVSDSITCLLLVSTHFTYIIIMGWYGDDHDNTQAYNSYNDAPKHQSHVSHELIAAAASYEAAKAYEQHKEKNGQPVNHAKAKEIAAGLAGAFIDKQFETHGLDFLDKQKAKHQAKQQVEQAIDQNGY